MKINWDDMFFDTFKSTIGILSYIGNKINSDTIRLREKLSIAIQKNMSESLRFTSRWKIEKYDCNNKLYDISNFYGNVALNEGLNTMLSLLCGGTGTAYSNANAQIGVGDSSTAAAATDTDLLGANKTWKAMDGGYPTYGTSQQVVFKSTFGASDGNHDWKEYSVRNSAGADKNLNRKVSDQKTKVSGSIWIVTITFTAS